MRFVGVMCQALAPLVALVSLLILVFTLTVYPGSYFTDYRWYAFLLHPNHDGGWFREYQLQVSHGQLGLAINTEVCADPEAQLLFWVRLDQTPTFTHNPVGGVGSGDIEFPTAAALGFEYHHLDEFDYEILHRGEGNSLPNRQWSHVWVAPCWVLLPLGLAGPIMLVRGWRSLRRRRAIERGVCTQCGYDLRASGNECPECGLPRASLLPRLLPIRTALVISGSALILICGTLACGGWVIHQRQHVLRAQYQATDDLMQACHADDTPAILSALNRGGDPSTSHSGPLRRSSETDNLVAVQAMIDRGVALNAVDHYDNTPIGAAIDTGSQEILQALLAAGAVLRAKDQRSDRLANMMTRQPPNLELIHLLLLQHVNLSLRDDLQSTPLLSAIEHLDVSLVRTYLDAGADPNEPAILNGRAEGLTPLHMLGWAVNESAADATRSAIARLLIAHHAAVNARDCQGWTPLHCAVFSKLSGLASALLDGGADVSIRDPAGTTPIDLAAMYAPEMRSMLTPRTTPTAKRLRE